MASGLRNKAEALALAGCDFLVVGPKVLTALDSAATLDGYNTGLSAAEEVPGSVERALSPQLAREAEFSPVELETVDGELRWWAGFWRKRLDVSRPRCISLPTPAAGITLTPIYRRMSPLPACRGAVRLLPGPGCAGAAGRGREAPGGGCKPPGAPFPQPGWRPGVGSWVE